MTSEGLRVLLATDGSDQALAATEWLRTFPLPRSSTIRVFAVSQTAHPRLADLQLARQDHQRLHAHAARIASEGQARLGGCGAEVEVVVGAGDPREEIIRTAEEWPADLVVLGARGLRPFQRALLGSVSTSIVRHAHCPVLVVRGRRPSLRTIALGVDGSPDSLTAAAFLSTLPLDPALRLMLIGVVVPPPVLPVPEAAIGPLFVDDALAQWEAETARALDDAAACFKGVRISIERRILIGEAGEQIVSAANATQADLVTVGARGHGAFERLLLGSVSEYVLHHAECPVLVVRNRP